uniref:hypothetical protein n=1 Tax=Parabacteroides goldsteinii TaxID=328812 RepID=UPI0027310910
RKFCDFEMKSLFKKRPTDQQTNKRKTILKYIEYKYIIINNIYNNKQDCSLLVVVVLVLFLLDAVGRVGFVGR